MTPEEKYLERAVESVAGLGRGNRSIPAYTIAFTVGGLDIDPGYAEGVLVAALVSTGMPEREARGHIRRGLRDGAKKPWELRAQDEAPRSYRPTPVRRLPAKVEPDKPLPALAELAELHAACVPVDRDDEVAAYLEDRGLDPQFIADAGLAFALLPDAPAPAFARIGGRTWGAAGYRLVLGLVDHEGVTRSVVAKSIREAGKSAFPTGKRRRGLVTADPLARQVLRLGAVPEWWEPDVPFRLVLAEGEADFLTWAQGATDRSETHPAAVVGFTSGSLTAEYVDRLPDGTRVTVASDPDLAGDRYAEGLAGMFGRRFSVRRWGVCS